MKSWIWIEENVSRYQRQTKIQREQKAVGSAPKKWIPISSVYVTSMGVRFFHGLSLIFFFDSRSPKHNELSKLSQLYCFLRPTEMRNLCVLHQNRQVSGDTFKKARFSFIRENTAAMCETRESQTSWNMRTSWNNKFALKKTYKSNLISLLFIFCDVFVIYHVYFVSWEKMSSQR